MLNQKTMNGAAMTPKQTKLIRETWDKIVPIADDAARMFYQRLFEIDPGTRPLFADTDMAQQRGKLLKALGLVVENAGQTESLTPVLEQMGRAHVRFGVEDRHYDSVGAALIWTLEQGLDAAFTEAVRSAWIKLYTAVSEPMRRAAGEVAAAAPRRSTLRHAAVALCLTMGLAGGLTTTTAFIGSDQARAWGLGDITDAAKDWGTSAADGIKRAGESVGRAAEDIAKGAAENASDFGAATKRDAKKIGGYVKDAATAAYDHNLIRTAIFPGLLPVLGAVGTSCGDISRYGKYGCDFAPRGSSPTPAAKPTPPATGPGSWGGPPKNPGGFNGPIKGVPDTSRIARKGPATGFAIQSLKSQRGNEIVPIKRAGRGNEVVPIKRGERGNEVVPIKRGERGNEVVPIRKGSDAPVQGIARENLKPGHGRIVRNPIARDRSVWGRPVGIKRPDAKSQPKVEPIIRDHRPGRETKPIVRDHRVKNTTQRVIVKDRRTGAAAPGAMRRDNRSSTRKSSSRRAPAASRIIRSDRGSSRVRTMDRGSNSRMNTRRGPSPRNNRGRRG